MTDEQFTDLCNRFRGVRMTTKQIMDLMYKVILPMYVSAVKAEEKIANYGEFPG